MAPLTLSRLENFLMNVGRAKFVVPLFLDLSQTDDGKVMAKRIYKKARPGYHPVTYSDIDITLGKPE